MPRMISEVRSVGSRMLWKIPCGFWLSGDFCHPQSLTQWTVNWLILAWESITAGTPCKHCTCPPNTYVYTKWWRSTRAFGPQSLWSSCTVGPPQDELFRPSLNNCMFGPRKQMEFNRSPPTRLFSSLWGALCVQLPQLMCHLLAYRYLSYQRSLP